MKILKTSKTVKIPSNVFYYLKDGEKVFHKKEDGRQYHVDYEGEFYYTKKGKDDFIFNELLSEKIASSKELTTPKLKLVLENNQFTLLSKDFKKKKPYVSGSLFSPSSYGNPTLFFQIEDYENYLKELEEYDEKYFLSLLKMTIFDIYTKNQDRSRGNYYFNKEDYSDMVLLDHENSFTDGHHLVQNEQFTLTKKSKSLLPYLKKYPELRNLVNQLLEEDILKDIQEIEEEQGIIIQEEDKQYYEKEIQDSKKLLKSWTKKL